MHTEILHVTEMDSYIKLIEYFYYVLFQLKQKKP